VKPRLLVHEPDPRLRADLCAYLVRAGYAASELEDLRFAASAPANAAAALARVTAATALDDIAALARALAPAPLILLCDSLTPARALALRALGAALALRAPFAPSALLDALEAVLRSPSPRSRDLEPKSPRMRALLRHAAALSRSPAALLIVGEHGSGRRWLARRIHSLSANAAGPFVGIDASDLAQRGASPVDTALDSRPARDLRTHASSAALDAVWEPARGGCLALSNPGELPPALQRELIARLESTDNADAPRLIACARGDRARVAAGLIPELWLRLSGTVLEVPPLRERLEDFRTLAEHFLARAAAERGLAAPAIDAAALAALAAHPFRGNLAELANLMQRAVIAGSGARLDVAALLDPRAPRGPAASHTTLDLETLERDAIERALAAARGNRTHASRALGISVRTRRNKLHRYGLSAS
jgi:two-component system response regulator PilR (NtrC family)